MAEFLTPQEQRRVAEGVRRGDRQAIERLLGAFRPLMSERLARMAYFLEGTEDWNDLSSMMVVWTIELTVEWDASRRRLDGYLKEYLSYRILDWLKVALPGRRQGDHGADEVTQIGVISDLEDDQDDFPDEAADQALEQEIGADAAGAALAELKAAIERLGDPYLIRMLALKLAGAGNPRIAQLLGVDDDKKVRNDWSRKIVKPIARPIFAKHGIPVPEG